MLYERKQARKAERQRKEMVQKKRRRLEKAAPALLTACERASTEIIAALEIPTDKRLEKDKDNLIYVIQDMRAREGRAQQMLKQAIAEAEEQNENINAG